MPRQAKAKMAVRRNPYFKFYPADFMRGVRGMTAQEVGVYTMLLCLMYEEDGPIGDDALRLATHCGMRLSTFTKTLEKLVRLGKIERQDGTIFNDRARQEIANRADALEIAIRAGKLSAEKRQQKQGPSEASVERSVNHTDTDTDTEKKEEKREAIASPKEPSGVAKRRDPVLEILSVCVSEKAALSFIAYRRKNKAKALTETAAKRLVGHLQEIFAGGGDCDDALGMAEEKGWASVQPDWYFRTKGNGNGNGSGHASERQKFGAAINRLADDLSSGAASLDYSSRDPFAARPRGHA